MKFCFKCGKEHPDDKMRPKFLNGKKIGSQCVYCIEKKSQSFYQKPPEKSKT